MGKINALCRRAGRSGSLVRRFTATLIAVAGTFQAAGSSYADESPLVHCWKEANTRIELAPCLRRLLSEAENRLERVQSKVERQAAELDHVTGNRTINVEKTRASDAHWRAYRDAECDRQSEAMSPGTGSGDVFLSCRIVLTNERRKHLEMP